MIYPKDKISIIDGNVSAFDEICNWYTFLNKEDITYVKSKSNNLHYAFDCKLVKLDDTVIGYYYGKDYYALKNEDIINKYDKLYEIFDFSIDVEDYSIEIALFVLNEIIRYASSIGCNKIIIKKTYDDFTPFYNLCLNNLFMKESSTYLYYEIVDYKMLDEEKYFIPGDNDKLSLLDIVYLNILDFTITKEKCFKTINNVLIEINRKTGITSILDNDIIYNESSFCSLIEYLIEIIENNKISDVKFNVFDVGIKENDNVILLGYDISMVYKLDFELIKTLKENGINSLICYNYKIDKYYMISSSKFKIEIDVLIKRLMKGRG